MQRYTRDVNYERTSVSMHVHTYVHTHTSSQCRETPPKALSKILSNRIQGIKRSKEVYFVFTDTKAGAHDHETIAMQSYASNDRTLEYMK